MAKEIILYNLKPEVTDEEYAKYVAEEKGPFLDGLPGAGKFHLFKVTASQKGEIPYKYVGMVDLTSMEEWMKTIKTEEFGKFIARWMTKVSDFHILFADEVY